MRCMKKTESFYLTLLLPVELASELVVAVVIDEDFEEVEVLC